MRRGPVRSQRLINHNCFNSINDVFRDALGARPYKYLTLLEYFHRDGGSSKGPTAGARSILRAALPCLALIALERNRRARPNRHAGPVPPDPQQPDLGAGFAAAPDRRRDQRPPLDDRQRAARLRDKDTAGAVAHRADPDLRPARRQRRVELGLRLAQPQAQEAEILSGPGEAETAAGPRHARAASCRTRRCGFRCRRRKPPTRRRSRRRWPAPWSASPRASGSRSTTIRSARSAITPAAS